MTDRAVSSTVEFVLAIAIAATLMSGLVVAASTMVERQNSAVGRSQMEAVGQQVAGGIESADRLNRTGNATTTMELAYDLPDRILSSGYTIDIEPGESEVVVSSSVNDETVAVPFDSETRVAAKTIDGGDFVIEYSSGELVVTDD